MTNIRSHSSSRWLNVVATLCVIAVGPYLVGFTSAPVDSTWTTIQVGAGVGSYNDVRRDCGTNKPTVARVPIREIEIGVDHHVGDLHWMIEGGMIAVGNDSLWPGGGQGASIVYAIPSVGIDARYYGCDVGYLLAESTHPTAIHGPLYSPPLAVAARIGPTDGIYATGGAYRASPKVTGGGLFELGIGAGLGPPDESAWIGLGGGSYDALMMIGRVRFHLSQETLLRLSAQLSATPVTEFGAAATLQLRVR